MKAVLKFDLNDEEERMAHFRCVKSLDMALAMWDFAGALRRIVDTSEDGKWIDEREVWKAWQEALDERGIRFGDLIC
jgi:hypothetical protein